MSRPLRIIYPGAYYHLTCRGNERKAIYRDDQDRRVFLERLKASRDIYQVRIHAFVLMSNHFHLIVETPKGNVSEFMRHFNISYTSAYNRRHNRVGHLYQGRYKAILIEKDSYLLELSRYVHLNPVRLRPYQGRPFWEKLRYLKRYKWSSLLGYISSGNKEDWVSYQTVLSYVGGSRKRYEAFVMEGVRGGYSTPWEEVKGQVVLGEEGFVERVKRRIGKSGSKREQPGMRQLGAKDPVRVLKAVGRYFGIGERELTGKRRGHREERGVALEMMYRYGGVSQREIGRLVGGLDYTAVSRERKRIREGATSDRRLRKVVEEIEELLMS